MKLKIYETVARYLLGIIFLFGAVDGVLYLFFDIHITPDPTPSEPFLYILKNTTYFWAFMKFIQLIGAISLLANYKPALGVALLAPVSSCLCLVYFFELQWYYAFTVVAVLTVILLRAYSESYKHMLVKYS